MSNVVQLRKVSSTLPTFYEFFAGGGMARAGLGPHWQCLFANDFDEKKAIAYRENWKGKELVVADITKLKIEDIPGQADLAWASFPCQDLSLAGNYAGLKGKRSGLFGAFWNHMTRLRQQRRAPKIIVLENVCGTLTSNKSKDFAKIAETCVNAGYRFGAVVIDAALFVPQSRPRVFMIAVDVTVDIPSYLNAKTCSAHWHTAALMNAYDRLPDIVKEHWIWWSLAPPPLRNGRFSDLIDENLKGVDWHSRKETNRLLHMMDKVNLDKVKSAQATNRQMVGTLYKRTRSNESGAKVQRAEVRFDDMAGCLRTPGGGSSRQLILAVEGKNVRSRLISARETARLMGLPDEYQLPENYNEAYHLTGDGVVVPVVEHLTENILEPILEPRSRVKALAA